MLLGICVSRVGEHISLGTHITRDMCFLGRRTQIPSDMCSPTLTGSGQLSSLGTGLVETLGKIAFIREKKLSKYKFVSVMAYKNIILKTQTFPYFYSFITRWIVYLFTSDFESHTSMNY